MTGPTGQPLQKYSFGFILPQGTKFYNLPPQGASTLDYFNELFGNSVQSPMNVMSPDISGQHTPQQHSQSTTSAQTALKPPQIKGTPTPSSTASTNSDTNQLQPASNSAATLTAQKGKLKPTTTKVAPKKPTAATLTAQKGKLKKTPPKN